MTGQLIQHHHPHRPRSAQPLAGRLLPRAPRSTTCWPNAPQLDAFRRTSDNLYERVRALFFLYAIHRFHLPRQAGAAEPAA